MRVDNILRDAIKDYFKDYDRFKADYNFGIVEDKVFFIYKGMVGYLIPKRNFLLDLELIFKDKTPFKSVNDLFERAKDAKELTYAYDKPIDKGTLSIYKNESGEEIAVNKKMLKHFEPERYETKPIIKGTTHKGIVYIFSEDEPLGLICPVNIKNSGGENNKK